MAECALTELPEEMCGCPKHRADLAPSKPTYTFTNKMDAKYPGFCYMCKDSIEEGETIVRFEAENLSYPEATNFNAMEGWIHYNCAKAKGFRH